MAILGEDEKVFLTKIAIFEALSGHYLIWLAILIAILWKLKAGFCMVFAREHCHAGHGQMGCGNLSAHDATEHR